MFAGFADANQFAENMRDEAAAYAESVATAFGGLSPPPPQQQGEASTTTSTTTSSTAAPPPVSAQTLRTLPQICIRSEDIQANGNCSDCVICLEPLVVGSTHTATRIPTCAHLFHTACLHDWLGHHSGACPTCRYELPQPDRGTAYEHARRVRMRHRKVRMTREALEKCSVRELRELFNTRRQQVPLPHHIKDRTSLMDYLISGGGDEGGGCVELIPSPPVVSYRLSELRLHTTPRQVRSILHTAGVHFDPARDVVEKEDMIQLLLASGRLHVLPEEEENENHEQRSSSSIQVETVDEEEEDDDYAMMQTTTTTTTSSTLDRETAQVIMEENEQFAGSTANSTTTTTTIEQRWDTLSRQQQETLVRYLECRSRCSSHHTDDDIMAHMLDACAQLTTTDQVQPVLRRWQQQLLAADRSSNTTTRRADRAAAIVNDTFFIDWTAKSLGLLFQHAAAAITTVPPPPTTTREALLDALRRLASDHPAARRYLQVAAPLAPLSLDQLRAVAWIQTDDDDHAMLEDTYDDDDHAKVQVLHQLVQLQLE